MSKTDREIMEEFLALLRGQVAQIETLRGQVADIETLLRTRYDDEDDNVSAWLFNASSGT